MNEERNKSIIYAPCSGEVIKLEDVPDEVFSSGIMGDGFAILPIDKKIASPTFGKVENAYKTGHAYTILSNDGLDILIHIGIDTVELDGEHFKRKVSAGDKVKKGDILATADIEKIKEVGFDPVCILVISNYEKMQGSEIKYGKCKLGDEIIKYTISN